MQGGPQWIRLVSNTSYSMWSRSGKFQGQHLKLIAVLVKTILDQFCFVVEHIINGHQVKALLLKGAHGLQQISGDTYQTNINSKGRTQGFPAEHHTASVPLCSLLHFWLFPHSPIHHIWPFKLTQILGPPISLLLYYITFNRCHNEQLMSVIISPVSDHNVPKGQEKALCS